MPDPETLEPERYELREGPAYEFPFTRRELGLWLTVTVTLAGQTRTGNRIHIAGDGEVTLFTGKVEVGQGARTQLAMAVAHELGVPLEKVKVVMADTDLVPNDGITAGSRTTPSTVPAVRKAAAALRESRGGQPAEVLGTSHHRLDGRAIVTGTHRFPSDIERPGMLHGAVVRGPTIGSTLISLEAQAAPKDVVVVHDGPFAGCAAPTSHAARKAAAQLAVSARWEQKEHTGSAGLYQHLKRTGSRPREQARGSLAEGLARAAKTLRAAYETAYIQHAPMEPRAAVAEWAGGRLTVWTGTQNPFGVRDQLAQAFHLPPASVRVIVPDTGGGFGGKHSGEAAIEAARLAREAQRPVSLRWTREEEFTWAYCRPAGYFEMEAGVDAGGLLTAWDHATYNAGAAAIQAPYRVANARTRFFSTQSPLREGSYRGIAATANTFAREVFMDELAVLSDMDPLEYRLANTEDSRLRAVLSTAAEKFRWKERTNRGIAGGTEKGSYVAACAEVSVRGGRIDVRRMVMAYECGAIQNPANLRAQVLGSIVMGLGGALTEEIRFEGGRVLNGTFCQYKVPRFKDVPPIEVILIDRKDLPSAGAGETPIIAVAPAIANAVYAATGKRSRTMPIRA